MFCLFEFSYQKNFLVNFRGFAAGIYTTNSAEACQYCLQNSRANIVVLEDEKQLEKVLKVKDKLPKLKAIIQYEGVPKTNGVLSVSQKKFKNAKK